MSEEQFWNDFWEDAEELAPMCEKCIYRSECNSVDPNVICGQFLRKKFEEFLGIEH